MTSPETDNEHEQESLWWKCPVCGKVGLCRSEPNAAGAEGSLRSHIYSSPDDGHGPESAFPDEFDPTTLTDYLSAEQPTQ